jgi:predicted O-linked N-acetylglucosamine transferase (SPINDLY family)
LRKQGKPDDAVACYRRALELKPDYADAHYNLGNAFQDQGKLEEAVACYRRALERKPDYAGAHLNMGNAFQAQGELEEAVACYRRALERKPDHAEAHNNLGNTFQVQGRLEEAVTCYCRALELQPDYAEAHSNLLYALQYRADATLSGLAQAHAEYERQRAGPLRAARGPHENARDPHRRLRLGFVSPDFGRHPVAFFLIRALENLDPGQGEVVCYNDRVVKDDLTARFRAAATTWRDVNGLSDKELAEAIVADRVDILFDLAGHTAGNRLLAFARKPAPIQVTWIGYEGTTGLGAIDYILADRYTIPPGQEAGYREQVLRMPDSYICYDPPTPSPEPGPLPAAQTGYVRFGSFNRPAKITPQVVGVWAKVLQARAAIPAPAEVSRAGRRVSPRALPGPVHGPGRGPATAGTGACEQSCRVLRGVPSGGHRAGPVPVWRRCHDLRRALDGRAGGHVPGGNVCRSSRPESSGQRRPGGNRRPGSGRVRRVGRVPSR